MGGANPAFSRKKPAPCVPTAHIPGRSLWLGGNKFASWKKTGLTRRPGLWSKGYYFVGAKSCALRFCSFLVSQFQKSRRTAFCKFMYGLQSPVTFPVRLVLQFFETTPPKKPFINMPSFVLPYQNISISKNHLRFLRILLSEG